MAGKKPWAGRFGQGTEGLVEAFTQSVEYDKALYRQDIAGSMAHARMLAKTGVLSESEAETIVAGLDQVLAEIESGNFTWKPELEDVHMNVEARLTEIVGPLGGKLHTARSRNDQVALDFRLLVAERLDAWAGLARDLALALMARAGEHAGTLMPGTTHLQPAQPVLLGHHLLAYCWMLLRDRERMLQARERTRVSPLGAAALAGTTHPIDPKETARALGLDRVFDNSMDAVSDRDFAAEALFAASLCMVHLSRLAEEIVIWSNPGFGFVSLPDAYATGSSIMPQKKNPDVCELVRGKTGRVMGGLVALLTMLKGQPLAYNRDMQEDKEPFFDADATLSMSLAVMAGLVREIGFNPGAMNAALKRGFLNATELADYLAAKGVPFREAHEAAGKAVARAELAGKGLEDLSLEELQGFSPRVEEDVFEVLDYGKAVDRRLSHGSTSPDSVRSQLERLALAFKAGGG